MCKENVEDRIHLDTMKIEIAKFLSLASVPLCVQSLL